MKRVFIYTIMCLLSAWITSGQAVAQVASSNTGGTIHVSGMVKENKEFREPLIGVNISVRTKKGAKSKHIAVSDFDGVFKIDIPANCIVEFSMLGFKTTSKKFTKSEDKVVIYMDELENQLTEVITIGSRKYSKLDNTSAVSLVDAKDLAAAPVSNAMELLQGRVAGLNIQMNNGMPGSTGTITIRGISDISVQQSGDDYILGSSSPLFVVDGIPQEDVDSYDANGLLSGSGVSPLSTVPFEDIDNIQVLKDAAATAAYGSRGAYGVILITTKKGNSSTPKINYSVDMKVNMPPKLRDVSVGRLERLARINQILQNDTSQYHGYKELFENQALTDSLNAYYNNNTDWQSQYYRMTANQTHNLSVSGGSTLFNYKVNGNYYSEKGIVKNTDFDRYSIRTNMGYNPNDKFYMSAAVNVTLSTTGNGSGTALSQTGVASGSSASSLLPPPSIYSATSSALGALVTDQSTTAVNYDASLNLNYRLPWNIRWNATIGYKYSNSEYEKFEPGMLNNNIANISSNSTNTRSFYGRTSLSYSTQFAMFRFGMTVGMEISTNRVTRNEIKLSGLPSDNIWGPVGNDPSSASGKASTSKQNNTVSFSFAPSFGIGEVGDERYVFNPILRPEANNAYGNKIKWIINPGLGFKWNYTKEPFFQKMNLDWLNFGDIRITWGRVTKYKADRYDIWGTYLLNKYTYNGEEVSPIDFGSIPNNHLDPITSTSWNLGFDLDLFGKFRIEMDAYYKQTDNQLSSVSIADHNAFDKLQTTEVCIVNYGLEVAMNLKPLPTHWPLKMNLGFNFAINKDVMAKLPNEARQIINNSATVVNLLGTNTLSNFLYVYKGVYATDEDVPVDPATGRRLRVGVNANGSTVSANDPDAYFRAGDPIWADLNGDYIIDEKDKKIVGNSQPRVTGGININLRYKNFSLFTNFSFTLKRDILNQVLANNFAAYASPNKAATSLGKNAALVPIDAYNFWTPDNIHADYPNPFDYKRASIINPFRVDQTLFQEDGSYFKINGITLSYSLPKKLTRFLLVSSASLRVTVNNIYTFSNYSGINPENVNSLGRDTSGGYPSARSFSVGFNLGL